MANQSSIFPIFLRAEYRNDGQGFARFQSDAQRAAQAAKREFEGVRTALDAALSRPRNTAGSLDLGVEELRQAALAQQQIAAAAREVANATRAAATANGQFDAAMSRSTRAAFELANAEERVSREMMEQVQALEAVQRELNQTASATNLVTEANRRGTTANQNVINSQRASRTAFIQLGQQLQDVAVQAQMGTNAFLIFGQQAPQAAFALSGLADSANRTQAAIGRFAQFMSGPWGAAIFVAVAALGPFVAKLFESKDAADDSTRSQRTLSEVLMDQTSSLKEVNAALDEYNRLQQRATQVTLIDIGTRAASIAFNLREAISIREKAAARIADLQAASRNLRQTGDRGAFGFDAAADAEARALQANADANDKAVKELIRAAGNVRVEAATEIARINSDSSARINAGFDILRQGAIESIKDVSKLSERLTQIEKDRQAALEADRKSGKKDRSGEAEARRRIRQAEQLAKFGESAAETIRRINERFDEQPRLIDAAAQATRQMDGIIADLEKRKPLNFQEMVKDAEAAKGTIEKALLRPIELIRQESEQRLAIEEALAAGQLDRAAALQEIFRLEQQIGILNDEQRADIEDIVVREQQRLRVLRDQQAVFNAQLDVLGTVRRDLTDILSGRSADFFGNFRQALRDLQGARLFEDLFGQAFRDIENELQKNTPQGRANQRLVDATDKASLELDRGGRAVFDFANAVATATNRILNLTAPANDNFSDGITVTGQRPGREKVEADISRMSTTDLASRIGRGITEPLEDLLGPRFAAMLGDVIGGFIAGSAIGGTPGGIIGAIKGSLSLFKDQDGNLSKTLASIDKALGKAGAGAAIGTQVAGIGKALGINTSTLGGQIGGAIGSFLPIPGGAIIGSVAGGLLGGLFKKTPRGSANLTGVDQFTLSGNNRAGAQDTATGLAGEVSDALRNIARQLGAQLGSFSTSIGVSGDSFHVDPTGRGRLKKSQGGIDFNQDRAAAVAFAIGDAIADGAIRGLSAAENRLLRANKDLESAVRDVLDFQSVFKRLREIKDPIGAATDEVNKEFDRLRELFRKAGADASQMAQLEELAGIERARAIQEATDRVAGSLRALLNDLRIGDNGLSLRDRRGNALTQFNALAARVAAGDSSAFDDFADISRQLLDIERQLFGSTQAYFDRLNQVTTLTERAISGQTGAGGVSPSAPAIAADNATIARTIESTSAQQVNLLRAINDNLILSMNPSLRSGGASGSNIAPMPAFREMRFLNF